jgi:hypothetical protein
MPKGRLRWVSFITAAKCAISQMRSYGIGIIFNGQSYAQMAQDIKDNTEGRRERARMQRR